MGTGGNYLVGLLGVGAAERNVLKRILLLSASRPRSYVLGEPGHEEPADILLVDRSTETGRAAWAAIRLEGGHAPVVLLGEQGDDGGYGLKRPLLATRVLRLLDGLVQDEFERGDAPRSEMPEPAAAPASRPASPQPSMASVSRPASPQPAAAPDSRSASPPAAARSATARGAASPPAFPAARRARSRALVVDDSLTVRRQLSLALTRAGIDADVVDTGEKALELVQFNGYDVILLDVVMPGVDGYEVCKSIKRNAGTRDTPVVMLTGKSSRLDRAKGRLSGCDSYLVKPVKLAAFKETLEEVLKRPVSFTAAAG
jgi:twitching motility two-component system response regulator PilG